MLYLQKCILLCYVCGLWVVGCLHRGIHVCMIGKGHLCVCVQADCEGALYMMWVIEWDGFSLDVYAFEVIFREGEGVVD